VARCERHFTARRPEAADVFAVGFPVAFVVVAAAVAFAASCLDVTTGLADLTDPPDEAAALSGFSAGELPVGLPASATGATVRVARSGVAAGGCRAGPTAATVGAAAGAELG